MNQIIIYFSDLSSEKQKDLLDLFQIKDPQEANWDIVPIFIIER